MNAKLRLDGLSAEEGEVADALAAAANAFARLPVQHPQELSEFVFGIHLCQGLLTTRLARRVCPEGWPTHSPPTSQPLHQNRPRHQGEITSYPPYVGGDDDPIDSWVPTCVCGWVGTEVKYASSAYRALADHLNKAWRSDG